MFVLLDDYSRDFFFMHPLFLHWLANLNYWNGNTRLFLLAVVVAMCNILLIMVQKQQIISLLPMLPHPIRYCVCVIV
jgi:hypothetical protein